MAEYKLDDLLCFQLYQASRAMTRLYKDVLKPLDLTYPQYIVMVLLWEHETMSFKELSDRLQLKTGTLSPLLKRLEKEGWIKRKHNRNDDRMIEVILGKRGLEYKVAGGQVPCEISDMLAYDASTYTDILRTVQEINGHLHEIEGDQEEE